MHRRSKRCKKGNLDPKKFTFADLINWRPKSENTLRKKWNERQQIAKEKMKTIEDDNVDNFYATNESKANGPRVILIFSYLLRFFRFALMKMGIWS